MADEDKSKRKYTRRSFTGLSGIDSVINDAVEEEATAVMNENGIDADEIEVEEIEAEKKPDFIYQEPKTDAVTTKMLRKLGIGGRMEPMKPWKGIPRWKCSRCGWETFSEKAAKKHVCS